jgi:hypothetical protein
LVEYTNKEGNMATLTKRQQKKIDRRVEVAYYATCSGIQINIMDIGRVFAVGREALRDGADEELLRSTIRKFVEQIRKN